MYTISNILKTWHIFVQIYTSILKINMIDYIMLKVIVKLDKIDIND